MRVTSETRVQSWRTSGTHPAADVHLPDGSRSPSIDLSRPTLTHALREPSTRREWGEPLSQYHHAKYNSVLSTQMEYLKPKKLYSLNLLSSRRQPIRRLRPCRSKSTSHRARVHCSSSSTRNRVAGRERVSCANSNPCSTHARSTASIKAVHSPVFKCSKMSNTLRSSAAGATAPSDGS